MTAKDCSQCGLTKDLAEFNRRTGSPDGRRGECRTCQAAYMKHYNMVIGKSAPAVCQICSGPLLRRNRHGVCRRNPECRRENTSLANRAKRADQGMIPPPCVACGQEYRRRKGMASNGRLCPACRADRFWCSGAGTGTGHVASLANSVGAATCRTCRMLRHAKKRASALGIPYTLTWQYVESIFPESCPYLGMQLKSGMSRQRASTPSLDRLEPRKGYVKGNVEVISYLANAMKQNATPEQLLTFAEAVLRRFRQEVRQ